MSVALERSIDDARELMIGQLIFALKNTLGEIKDKVIRIARRKKQMTSEEIHACLSLLRD